jgi:hypothetical protein
MIDRLALTLAATALIALPTPPVYAQPTSDAVMAGYEEIAGSVIRIRTIADLEFTRPEGRSGEVRMAKRPYSIDGTGVVVGEIEVEGRLEYLILTNHHVADASNYVLEEGGYLRMNPSNTRAIPSVHEKSYLMQAPTEEITDADIQLIELIRLAMGDMKLMRTVGANRELTVFRGEIGYRHGEVAAGDPIVTSGFPWGGERVVTTGRILETDHRHELGIPHDDLIVDMPVEPGQSGGPIFLVEMGEGEGESIGFRLIGLVHARDSMRSYVVPYTLWDSKLDEFPEVMQPRLAR